MTANPTRLAALAAAVLTAASLGLAACDGGAPEIADVTYDQVRSAAADPATFDAFFDTVKTKAVAWSGHVKEARIEHGDDFVEIGRLHVEMDPPGTEPAVADIEMEISPADVKTYSPGQAITFTAIVLGYSRRPEGIVLSMSPREIR